MTNCEPSGPPAAGTAWQRVFRWITMIYLLIMVFQPVFDPTTRPWRWYLAAALIAAGAALVLVGQRWPEHARWASTIPLAALSVAAMPLNTGAAILLVYAAGSAGRTETRRDAIRWFAALTVLLILSALVSPVAVPWRFVSMAPSLIFLWVIGLVMIEEADRARDATELRLRNARIEHLATMSERERIARDLHDLLGHSLTAVVMRAQLIVADPARAAAEAAEIESTAREALTQVRNALSGWRQANLETELESARGTLSSLGIDLVVEREPGLVLVGSAEHELALALREAVTNVARHTRAGTCRVEIGRADGEFRMRISDDGVGGKSREGNGLTGIRERVTALGGRLDRVTVAGTTLTIAVPLEVAM
ncbi:MAG: desK1 [Amycolatopsis sp.]|uniref:sensor histidine kinase n=1 Tax=Amycolatopsis sp. TaxID=37632 RepID=UPI002621DF36|nr:histidine kinase [Amycolatopsis sp.]MCU1681353.1 desK1 [Amycolatopsis sp.]